MRGDRKVDGGRERIGRESVGTEEKEKDLFKNKNSECFSGS